MSFSQPSESFPVPGKCGSSMKLTLHGAGDHNGNAFPMSSSSSSSSSSSLGESSPELLQRSLCGGQTDSPLDYDMVEVTLMTAVMADVMISKWTTEDSRRDGEDNEVSIDKMQSTAEMSESSDNSVSVYLDANSDDAWNANDLTTTDNNHNKGAELGSGRGMRGSTAPYLETTEIPDDDDDDDDEEEALFLSLSFDVGVQKNSLNTSSQMSSGLMMAGGCAVETVAKDAASDEGLMVDCPLDPSMDSQEHLPLSTQTLSSHFPSPSPAHDPSLPPSSTGKAERCALSSKSIQHKSSHTVRAARNKAITTRPVPGPGIKPATMGKRGSTIVPKVASSSKSPSQRNKSAAANEKKALSRKEAMSGEVEKPLVKAAVVLKPLRGQSSNPRTQNAAAGVSRSTSVSSLGSEMVEKGSSRKTVRNVVDKQGTMENEGTTQCSDQAEEQAVRTDVEKPRTLSRVSSKLGPSVRQHGRGFRVSKGPASPPGSSAERLGPGSPGARQVQKEALGEGPQNAGSGSPPKARQTPNQSQALGLPGRLVPTTSRLPVKGSPPSLGHSDNDAATSKATGFPVSTGTKPDEWPSRSMVPAGGQRAAKPPGSSTAAALGSSAPSAPTTPSASRPPAIRARAVSLQARATAAGLKTSASSLSATKAAAASQGPAKQTCLSPLQRSGSARLSRLNGSVWARQLCMTTWQMSVDKNKPREAPARPVNTSSSSHAAAPAGGTNQNQQQPPPDLVADVVNSNAPVTPVLPVLPSTESSNTDSGFTDAPVYGFKARTALRSSHKPGSRIHSVCSPGTAEAKQSKEPPEKGNQTINQLRRLLVQGNRRVEALATVIQHLFTEREEALKQKKDLLLELESLRAELAVSTQCYERLQKEKEEVRLSIEESLKRREQQHQEELVQLEDRLRQFYQTEWDKVHQTYQEEADKCRRIMEQQVEELKSQQEAERKKQEMGHSQKVQAVRQQYETSIQDLRSIHQTDMENLEKILKETESSLSEQLCELSAEKASLSEKLQAEEEKRRRILSDKNLKDSHTLYLEQELESLKVVLEIKNDQLHQKEKKLMEMDKVVETNVKLEECLKKVQQENEDYRARMDKHAALSKQLSSEQAKLQQTLQKESKVNKRLSMENEELLWKLHNGDLLASPRHASPPSPFSSPRNSASFPTAAPVSPR
ncbi:microtubule-associated tumor suppressor 1 homolog isoform X2 [Betta splendens]|uniref:Microtubule-associated tumor suppressor 1 homolog isoform X2 n=1 Tax=Betta splendens TaxID=158456 RepID=A0A6P7LVF9_BETSP|nr:microtubule-associated tumor suppressor 1 homolog isoform X2 [Betta splendens]